MTEADRLRAELDSAIADVLATHGTGTQMATRWVSVVEVIDGNGQRWLWSFPSPGLMRWDVLGLLDYAHQLQNAATVNEESA